MYVKRLDEKNEGLIMCEEKYYWYIERISEIVKRLKHKNKFIHMNILLLENTVNLFHKDSTKEEKKNKDKEYIYSLKLYEKSKNNYINKIKCAYGIAL